MPRLRNSATGVVVNVSDDRAKLLTGFEPVESPKPKAEPKKAAAKDDSPSE